MKIRTSIHAGGEGCSPETQYYMQQAAAMASKINNCLATQTSSSGTPYYGYYYPYPYYPTYPTTPTYPTYVGSTYPDMSGACG